MRDILFCVYLIFIGMDIDFLAKMVKELLLDNDKVALPGLGSFVAEMAPSVFSDRGYTINPPYRKLSFRENVEQDDLLVKFFAVSAGITEDESRTVLTAFIAEMRDVLNRQKTIIFPELGRLRATKENNYFFVADEDMDIYPDGLGLEPVSLKAHSQPEQEMAGKMVPEMSKEMVPEKTRETVPEMSRETVPEMSREIVPEKAEPVEDSEVDAVESEEEDVPEVTGSGNEDEKSGDGISDVDAGRDVDARRDEGYVEEAGGKKGPGKGVRVALIVVCAVVALAVVALGVFILLAHLCPDFIDSILYTEEELEILRYSPVDLNM